jgi:hypothetical protein
MSMIRDGFRSLYHSGAFLTETLLPKTLEKTGFSRRNATTIGASIGSAIGLASLVVGSCFLAALPMSLPMFSVAITVYAAKGIAMVAAMTAVLSGTGVVVTTTGIGMCRDMAKRAAKGWQKTQGRLHRKSSTPPAQPEKTAFGNPKAAPGFQKAVAGTAPAAAPADGKLSQPAPQPG